MTFGRKLVSFQVIRIVTQNCGLNLTHSDLFHVQCVRTSLIQRHTQSPAKVTRFFHRNNRRLNAEINCVSMRLNLSSG